MARHPHLSNAPLVEALLDIRVEPAPGLSLEQLTQIADQMSGRYPARGERRTAGIAVLLDASTTESTTKATTTAEGFVLRDVEGKRLAQVTLGGFTQNLLKPYSDFESLVEEAQRNWRIYVDLAKPQRIVRTALRYINDLRVPVRGNIPFEKFLPFVPMIPPSLPQTTIDFASRVTIMDPKLEAKAIVAQLFSGAFEDDEGAQVILDIDAISERALPIEDEAALWKRFEDLRQLKNEIFFSYTTPELLEKYK